MVSTHLASAKPSFITSTTKKEKKNHSTIVSPGRTSFFSLSLFSNFFSHVWDMVLLTLSLQLLPHTLKSPHTLEGFIEHLLCSRCCGRSGGDALPSQLRPETPTGNEKVTHFISSLQSALKEMGRGGGVAKEAAVRKGHLS
jgi:hypothetical protein